MKRPRPVVLAGPSRLPPWTTACTIGWLLVLAPLGLLLAEWHFLPDTLDFELAAAWAQVPLLAGLAYAIPVQIFVGDAARYAAARNPKSRGTWPLRFYLFLIPAVLAGLGADHLLMILNQSSAVPVREAARIDSRWLSSGKGCHQHVQLAGAPHWPGLRRCVSPGRYAEVVLGSAVTVESAVGSIGQAVTRIDMADGSPL